MAAKLGLVTIGQSPRLDYEDVFREFAPSAEILWAGALDGMDHDDAQRLAAADHEYPLHTGLADGTNYEISLNVLLPLVADHARRLADQGAQMVVVLCAGGFPTFECPVPLVLPGTVIPAVVGSICRRRRVGVVTPNAGQIAFAQKKWAEDGFDVDVVAAAPGDAEASRAAAIALANPELELIVLDCMGHNSQHQRSFAELSGRPAVVAQNIVARVVGEYMNGCVGVEHHVAV
jgi:protein AroM